MSPSETALLTQIAVGAGVLFVIAYLGNRLSFSNRFVNALVTAIVFAAIYAVLAYTVDTTMLPPELQDANRQTWLQMILMSAALVFVIDLVANMISFSNRLTSALVTAVLFALLFGLAVYSMGGLPAPTAAPTAVTPTAP